MGDGETQTRLVPMYFSASTLSSTEAFCFVGRGQARNIVKRGSQPA
jgi:hypothetical protein